MLRKQMVQMYSDVSADARVLPMADGRDSVQARDKRCVQVSRGIANPEAHAGGASTIGCKQLATAADSSMGMTILIPAGFASRSRTTRA